MRRFIIALLLPLFCGVAVAQTFDRDIAKAELVDVQALDSTIGVDLKYSSDDNFMHCDVYGSLDRAYLVDQMARRVVIAQKALWAKGYSLMILDAARPISVQRTMWSMVVGTGDEIYVANPARGGMHNYGAAVDVTIVDTAGVQCDMGSTFDFFGPRAWVGVGYDTQCRLLLIEEMKKAGLKVYRKEWWHYELQEYTSPQIREKYTLLDF